MLNLIGQLAADFAGKKLLLSIFDKKGERRLLNVSVSNPSTQFPHTTVWGKQGIKDVNLSRPGGAAINGNWIEFVMKNQDHGVFVASMVSAGPIVVGVAFKDKKDGTAVQDKIAMVAEMDASAPYRTCGYKNGLQTVTFAGTLKSEIIHGVNADAVLAGDPALLNAKQSSDPYYWAAAYLYNVYKVSSNDNDVDAPSGGETLADSSFAIIREGGPPVRAKGDLMQLNSVPFIPHGRKKIPLPIGFVCVLKVLDVYVLGYDDKKGNKTLGFMTALVESKEPISKELAALMEEQAPKLEALAMAYRMIASAKVGETSQKKKGDKQ